MPPRARSPRNRDHPSPSISAATLKRPTKAADAAERIAAVLGRSELRE